MNGSCGRSRWMPSRRPTPRLHGTFISLANRTAINTGEARAQLRAASGECFPVKGVATRIGRRSDNDIVLADQRVSRHHAVIIDTGTSFVLIDARSANGVELDHNRIRGSAPLCRRSPTCASAIVISSFELRTTLGRRTAVTDRAPLRCERAVGPSSPRRSAGRRRSCAARCGSTRAAFRCGDGRSTPAR